MCVGADIFYLKWKNIYINKLMIYIYIYISILLAGLAMFFVLIFFFLRKKYKKNGIRMTS